MYMAHVTSTRCSGSRVRLTKATIKANSYPKRGPNPTSDSRVFALSTVPIAGDDREGEADVFQGAK